MSSIGRTHHHHPLVTRLAYAALGVLVASSLTIYSLETLEKLTKTSPVSIDDGVLTDWLSVPVKGAQLDAPALAVVDARLNQAMDSAKSAVVVTPPKALEQARVAAKRVGRRRFVDPQIMIRRQLEREQQEIALLETAVEKQAAPVMVAVSERLAVDSLISTDAVALQAVHSSLRRQFMVVMNTQPAVDNQVPRLVSQLDEMPGLEVVAAPSQADLPKPPEPPAPLRPDQTPSLARAADVSEEKPEKKALLAEAPLVAPDADTLTLTASSSVTTIEAIPADIPTYGLDTLPEETIQAPALKSSIAQAPPPAARVAPPLPDRVPSKPRASLIKPRPATSEIAEVTPPSAPIARMNTQALDEMPADSDYPLSLPAYESKPAYTEYSSSAGPNQRVSKSAPVAAAPVTLPAVAPARKTRPVLAAQPSVTVATMSRSSGTTRHADSLMETDRSIQESTLKSLTSSSADSFVSSAAKTAAAPASSPRKTRVAISTRCDSELLGVEAFSNSAEEELISVCRRAITHEGPADGKQARWWEAQESLQHWPTLLFQSPSAAREGDRIPMLSFNNVKLLGALARTPVQNGAGIVFGEVPAGWSVDLSGRAERPLFFDAQLKAVDGANTDIPRRFAFLNVAPGTPLLYVTAEGGGRSGAIAILVKAGSASFVDVPDPRLRTFSGRILDASSASIRGVSAVSVEVIGQEGRTAITSNIGGFSIPNVLAFGEYPLYVDVAPDSQSFKHRYGVASTDLFQKSLFYFREQQVSQWVSQLEGGVSPASGFLVGALPRESLRPNSPTVRIATIEKKTSLQPEAYVLGEDDHLIPDPSLSAGKARFIGVQVPEGIAIPSVVDSAGLVLWSKLVIAQPGVLNVLGQ